MTTPCDMMTDDPGRALAREIDAYLRALPDGARGWTVGEAGWDGAVQIQHHTWPQMRVYSLAEAWAHMQRHA